MLLLAVYEICIPHLYIGAVPLTGNEVIDGNGLVLLNYLHCTGNESRLVDCSHSGYLKHGCNHSGDAGVRCLPSFSKSIYNII